jgi:5-methylcytosine-specific restriction endonuclease McrA
MSVHSARGPEWERARLATLNRDGWICVACGKDLEGDDATVDHIEPVVAGGDKYDLNNLISLCRRDNSIKGDRIEVRTNYVNSRWLVALPGQSGPVFF